ncbi:MAG: hypothetical protein GF390_00885, partial [Candidatus Pacebacteria bacterium]|nr:hypothetical protein [Candidatus Paceibacterota bacterium]
MLKLLAKKKPPASGENCLFLAILLLESSVQTVLWTVEAGQIKVLEKSAQKFYRNENDCLIKTDQALQELGPQSETIDEVIFVFEPDWIQAGDLQAEKKPLLKKLTKDLSLKPLGFVILTESLSEHFLQVKAQQASILVYFSNSYLHLMLLEQADLKASVRLGSSDNLVNDLVEGLAQIKRKLKQADKTFPPQVYLASPYLTKDELISNQQQLISHQWGKQYFPTTPLVEIFSLNSLFKVAVQEAGKVVAGMKNLPLADGETKLHKVDKQAAQVAQDNKQMSSFGVPIDQKYILPNQDLNQKFSNVQQPEPLAAEPSNLNLDKLKANKPPSKLAKLLVPFKKIILLGVLTGLLVFLSISYVWLRFFSEITINITPADQVVAKEVDITLDPEADQSQPEELILKAKLVTKKYTETGLEATSGEKTIGEQAKGKVTILNKTTEVKTFDQGTVLKANGLTFTLDQSVKVASASVV